MQLPAAAALSNPSLNPLPKTTLSCTCWGRSEGVWVLPQHRDSHLQRGCQQRCCRAINQPKYYYYFFFFCNISAKIFLLWVDKWACSVTAFAKGSVRIQQSILLPCLGCSEKGWLLDAAIRWCAVTGMEVHRSRHWKLTPKQRSALGQLCKTHTHVQNSAI